MPIVLVLEQKQHTPVLNKFNKSLAEATEAVSFVQPCDRGAFLSAHYISAPRDTSELAGNLADAANGVLILEQHNLCSRSEEPRHPGIRFPLWHV